MHLAILKNRMTDQIMIYRVHGAENPDEVREALTGYRFIGSAQELLGIIADRTVKEVILFGG